MRKMSMCIALLLGICVPAKADSFTAFLNTTQGQNLTNGQYAGPFTITDNTTGQNLVGFCVDLTDHVFTGPTNFTGTIQYGGIPNDINTFLLTHYTPPFETPASVGNRLDYLITQVWDHHGLFTPLENSNFQAALWDVMGNYGYTGGYTPELMKLVGAPNADGAAVSGSSWSLLNTIAPYDQTKTYASPDEFLILPDYTSKDLRQYQVLVGISPVPEPSSLALGMIAAIAITVIIGLRRIF